MYAAAEGDAKAMKTTPEALAAVWARNLNAALHIDPLKVSDEFAQLPVGGGRTLKIGGLEAARATIKSDQPGIVSVQRTAGGMYLYAKGLGHATVTVQGPTAMKTVDVTVRPRAATLPSSLSVEVTGAPSMGSTVQGAVEGALRTSLGGAPGVRFKIGPIRSRSMESGTSLSVPVRVSAEARGIVPDDRRGHREGQERRPAPAGGREPLVLERP